MLYATGIIIKYFLLEFIMANKKEYILDIAEELFGARGYTAVGVDMIRDKAEVSKTSMYKHFGSKNKLIEAVLIRRHHRFVRELTAVVSSERNQESRMNAILDWHFSWFQSVSFKGCMFMHALAEFKDSDDSLAQHATQHKEWLKSLIASTFEPDTKELEEKSEAIMTFLEGMIIRAEFSGLGDDEEVYRLGARALSLMTFSSDK